MTNNLIGIKSFANDQERNLALEDILNRLPIGWETRINGHSLKMLKS